eukprot:1379515-Rhodomonas_salina.7
MSVCYNQVQMVTVSAMKLVIGCRNTIEVPSSCGPRKISAAHNLSAVSDSRRGKLPADAEPDPKSSAWRAVADGCEPRVLDGRPWAHL